MYGEHGAHVLRPVVVEKKQENEKSKNEKLLEEHLAWVTQPRHDLVL